MADTYVVQKGDTLSKIAQRLGMKLSDLIKYNKALIKDPDKIKIGWQLKLNDGPPPEQAGGPIKGKGGRGYTVTYEPKGKPFEPKVVNPESPTGRVASAPLKEDTWRKGKEIFDEVKTPVQIAVPAPPPPPAPKPEPPTPFGETMLGRVHSYLDPVAVMSSNAGDPNYKASANDYIGLALQGFGGGVGRPAPPAGMRVPPRMPGAGAAWEAPTPLAESPVTNAGFGDVAPTEAMMGRYARAKQRPSSEWFDPWQSDISYSPIPGKPYEFRPNVNRAVPAMDYDPHGGMSNVRPEYPYEPELPATGEAGQPPVGARERTVTAPEPMVYNVGDFKSLDDVRNALRAASDNTVIIDGASDMGFTADRVIIIKGKGGMVDPEKALNSPDTPVLSQGMFARILAHLGGKG